jgi:RNA methyltransferase, TrmH family
MNAPPPLIVESPQNPRFKTWEAALDGRGIRKTGCFLLAGRKTVPEALRLWPERFEAVLAPDEEAFAALPVPPRLSRVCLAKPLFERLDVSGTGFPLLAGRVPEMPPLDPAEPPQGLELVLALSDPNNLGAALRSAAAFDARRIVLMPQAAHPFHPRCLRAAANAPFALTLLKGPAWEALAAGAGPLLALDGGGEDIDAFPWPDNARLVLGEEGQGVPAGLNARRLAIVTTGAVESLNATVAASLALHARYRFRRGEVKGPSF